MGGFKKIFQDRAGEQRHALKQPHLFSAETAKINSV
jgi:hypothetical protein